MLRIDTLKILYYHLITNKVKMSDMSLDFILHYAKEHGVKLDPTEALLLAGYYDEQAKGYNEMRKALENDC